MSENSQFGFESRLKLYLKSAVKFKTRYTARYMVTIKHSPASFSIKRLSKGQSKAPDDLAFGVNIDRLFFAPSRYGHLFGSSNHALPNNTPFYSQQPRYNLRKIY